MAHTKAFETRRNEKRLKHLIDLTAQIVASHAGGTAMPSKDLPNVIQRVFTSLSTLKLDETIPSAREDAVGEFVTDTEQTITLAETSDAASNPIAETEVSSEPTPAVAITDSITPDHLICLEDGKPVKLLHRYLKTKFQTTPAEYRKKWDLPSDYPMVAPAYSESRRAHGARVGFKKRDAAAQPSEIAVTPPSEDISTTAALPKARRGRRPNAGATGASRRGRRSEKAAAPANPTKPARKRRAEPKIAVVEAPFITAEIAPPPARKRGRPPKVRPTDAAAAPNGAAPEAVAPVAKKPRRAKGSAVATPPSVADAPIIAAAPKRRRKLGIIIPS